MNQRAKLYALPGLLLILLAAPSRLPGQACDSCAGGSCMRHDACSPCQSCESRSFCESCGPCNSGCACETCCPPPTCTILVPQMVTEYQTQCVVRYRPQVCQRMVTVYRDVPTDKTVEEQYTVLVPQQRTRTVSDVVNRPVYGDIQLRTTRMIPEVDVRQASYTVTQMVPVQEERVARPACCATAAPPAAPPPAPDPPANEAPPAPPVAGGCNGCCEPCPCKVCVTSWKPVPQQVRVQYPLTRFKPESRLDTVSFYEYKPETRLREESYVVQVPETRTRTRHITVMRTVAEQRPEQYTVMVPYQEQIQVPVVSCRCVEQTVALP